MISRGRIHLLGHCAFGRAFLVALLLVVGAAQLRAESGPIVEVINQEVADLTTEEVTTRAPQGPPLHIVAGVDMGYDDNINTSSTPEGAWFTAGVIALTYEYLNARTQLHLRLGGGLTHYFSSESTEDENASIVLELTHNFSTRFSLTANVDASYQVEPDFSTNIGPENVRAAHLQSTDLFAISYSWLPRLVTITSCTFRRIMYDDFSIGMFQDRLETTLGEVIQLKRSHRTNVFGEYRYQMIDYDSVPNNSTTQYGIVGIEHKFTEHIGLTMRGGGSYRSYDQGGDRVDPYFESSFDFSNGGRSSIRWTTNYGIEDNSGSSGLSVSQTFRTGIQLSYQLSSRITSTATVYYNHSVDDGSASTQISSGSSQDSLEMSLNLLYTISRRLKVHLDYGRTSVSSAGFAPGSAPDYNRNRYFAGLTLIY